MDDKKAAVPASEKAKALAAALAQIEKQFGKGSIMKLGQREALEITLRYIEARQRNFSLRSETRDGYVYIQVREKHPIPVLRAFFYENILIGFARGERHSVYSHPERVH